MMKTSAPAASSVLFASLTLATLLSAHAVLPESFPAPVAIRGDRDKVDPEAVAAMAISRRRLVWSDFLYPATDPESPLNFELDPFNATAELTASQQDDIIYAAQHPTPAPTEKSTWKKFWHIFF